MRAEDGSADAVPLAIQGCLLKQSAGLRKRWQERYFTVQGHYLKYYESKETKSDSTLKGTIDVLGITSVRVVGGVQIDIGTEDGNSAKLRASSEQVASLWVQAIKDVRGKEGKPKLKVFWSHAWGNDEEGRDNHARVIRENVDDNANIVHVATLGVFLLDVITHALLGVKDVL